MRNSNASWLAGAALVILALLLATGTLSIECDSDDADLPDAVEDAGDNIEDAADELTD